MPILARDAKIGDVLKPSKNATSCLSCLVLLWEKSYVVMRKEPSGFCIWVNDVADQASNYRHWKDGLYQIRGDVLMLYPDDPRPTDSTRVIQMVNGKPDDAEPKRSRGGPETVYEFAFDDDDVKIDDMPRQALLIADLLHSTGRKSFTELEIENIVSTPEAITEFKSKQPPMTIFRFYRSEFQKRGFINRK